MLTIKKNQTVKAIKEFKVSGQLVLLGQVLLIVKGGKKPNFYVFLNNDIQAFSMSEKLEEYFEDVVIESKMEQEIARIKFKKINHFETHRGAGLTAEVFFDGEKVGDIENNGCGGETTARFYGNENQEKLKEIIGLIDNIRKPLSYDSEGDKLEAVMNYQMLNEGVFISFEKRCMLDQKNF